MDFLDLLMISSAVGGTTAYLLNMLKEKKIDERPLSAAARKQVEALNELVTSNQDIALSSPSVKVQVTGKMQGYLYHFYYQQLQQPFLTFFYEPKTETIVNVSMTVLKPNHKEVKLTLEKIKNKVIEKHTGKSVLTALAVTDEVNPKYKALLACVKNLQTHTEIEESERTLLVDSIEPLLDEVMVKFTALNKREKEVFASKALDIFYAVEKTIKTMETAAEKKKNETTARYFIEMEKQAVLLTDEKG